MDYWFGQPRDTARTSGRIFALATYAVHPRKQLFLKFGITVSRGIGGWGSWLPLKICMTDHSMFWPPNVTIFHSKLLMLDNSASFTSSRMKVLCQKWKVILIFRDIWNSLMAWPGWSRPPHFTTYLRHWLRLTAVPNSGPHLRSGLYTPQLCITQQHTACDTVSYSYNVT